MNQKLIKQLADQAREMDEALLSMDELKIKKMCLKYDITLPPDERMFWPGIHKAITKSPTLPENFKMKSHNWLIERGFKSLLLTRI